MLFSPFQWVNLKIMHFFFNIFEQKCKGVLANSRLGEIVCWCTGPKKNRAKLTL